MVFLKVSVINGDQSVFENQIESRPFGFNRDKFDYVDDPYKADWIYLNLHFLNCNQEFQSIRQTKVYQDNADRCVLWTMHDNPVCAYSDPRPLKFVSQPLYGKEINEKGNVIPVPLQMRHFEYDLIQDLDFIEECRNQEKIYDFLYIGQIAYANREWLLPENINLKNYLFRETTPIYGVQDVKERVSIIKDFCLEVAKSRYCFSPRGAGSSSFRFYQSLMVGTVPIVSGMNDYPFSGEINWNNFSVIDDSHTKHNELISYNEHSLRENGMNVWDKYFRIDKTDEHLFCELEKRKI